MRREDFDGENRNIEAVLSAPLTSVAKMGMAKPIETRVQTGHFVGTQFQRKMITYIHIHTRCNISEIDRDGMTMSQTHKRAMKRARTAVEAQNSSKLSRVKHRAVLLNNSARQRTKTPSFTHATFQKHTHKPHVMDRHAEALTPSTNEEANHEKNPSRLTGRTASPRISLVIFVRDTRISHLSLDTD